MNGKLICHQSGFRHKDTGCKIRMDERCIQKSDHLPIILFNIVIMMSINRIGDPIKWNY